MSWDDYDPIKKTLEVIRDNAKSLFPETKTKYSSDKWESDDIDEQVLEKINPFILEIYKQGIHNFYISGGLATAVFFIDRIDWDNYHSEFNTLFEDVDVYIKEDFNELKKKNKFIQTSENIIEYYSDKLKRKFQFINIGNVKIADHVDKFDLNINKCYIEYSIYKTPKLFWNEESIDDFDVLRIESVNNKAKVSSLERMVKYIERYNIEKIDINPKDLKPLLDYYKETVIKSRQEEEQKLTAEIQKTNTAENHKKNVENLKRFKKLDF